MIRLDTSEINPFNDMLIAKERYSTIGVDLSDGKWANCSGTKRISLVVEDHDLITNVVVMVFTTLVFSERILINNRLAFGSEEFDISDDRNWKEHITMEGNSSR